MAHNDSNIDKSELMNSIGNMNHKILFDEIILNDLLFQKISEYLNNTNMSENNILNILIMNVSKKFQGLKKDHFYWKLNKKYSLIYYNSSPYRERITSLVKTKKQLSLNLSGYREVVDVSDLADVHTLNLRFCNNISDVSALGGVYKLNLTDCKRVIDVSALGQVHHLILRNSDVVDVSALGGVHTLNLSHCRNLVNVSALGTVHDLDLSNCDNIVDVSALLGVQKSDPPGCKRVHRLNISGCKGVVDISALGQVHDLNLHGRWLPRSRCKGPSCSIYIESILGI